MKNTLQIVLVWVLGFVIAAGAVCFVAWLSQLLYY